jgi:DNA-binding CsgD family transcriptional regulator
MGRREMAANWKTERVEQEIIRLCHAGLDSQTLRQAVFTQIDRIMPYEAYWCATTDPETLLFTGAVEHGFDAYEIQPYIDNELMQGDFNKFTALAQARNPVSTLKIATHGDLTRSQRYREILEPAGLGHEMRAVFRSGGAVWGAMCLHRVRRFEDFTLEHIAFFAAVAPHLAEGLRAALLLETIETTPTVDGPGLLLLTDNMTVIAVTPGARLLLDEVCGWTECAPLPMAVTAVVTKLHALETAPEHAAGSVPYVRLRTRAGRWLTLHASRLSSPSSGGQVAVIIELATPNDIAPFVLQAYALTAREQEVAGLVLKGRSTDDIATLLSISSLTVQQHLKSIFDKVGVRSRRDLVAHIFAQSYLPSLMASHNNAPDRPPHA